MIKVGEGRFIHEKELEFTASRSSGPGGQNVNKVSTRVTLFFDLVANSTLSAEEKQRIRDRLATRISKKGVLRVVCQRYRTQKKNRQAAIERFGGLVESALAEKTPRIKTEVPGSVKQRRLEEKARRSRIKKLRSKPVSLEE